MFRNVSDRTTELAANRQTLQQAQSHKQGGGCPPDGLVRGQEANCGGGEAHDQHGHKEGFLPADKVTESAKNDCTKGSKDEACAERRQGREQSGGFITLREEQSTEEGGKGAVDKEVIPFENGSERGRKNGPFRVAVQIVRFWCDL